jgi:hypothetical protein
MIRTKQNDAVFDLGACSTLAADLSAFEDRVRDAHNSAQTDHEADVLAELLQAYVDLRADANRAVSHLSAACSELNALRAALPNPSAALSLDELAIAGELIAVIRRIVKSGEAQ